MSSQVKRRNRVRQKPQVTSHREKMPRKAGSHEICFGSIAGTSRLMPTLLPAPIGQRTCRRRPANSTALLGAASPCACAAFSAARVTSSSPATAFARAAVVSAQARRVLPAEEGNTHNIRETDVSGGLLSGQVARGSAPAGVGGDDEPSSHCAETAASHQ